MSTLFNPATGMVLKVPRTNMLGVALEFADSPVTLTSVNNTMYRVDTTGGDVIINLPDITSGNSSNFCYIVIEGTNKVTLVPSGTQTVSGSASRILDTTDYGLRIVSNFVSEDWEVFIDSKTPRNPLADKLSNLTSSSILTELTVTDHGDGTATLSSVEAFVKESSSPVSPGHVVTIPELTTGVLTANNKYYIVGDWNAGSPIFRLENATGVVTINNYSIFACGILTRGLANEIYHTDFGLIEYSATTKILRRLDDTQGLIVRSRGAVVGSSDTRYLQISEGFYYVSSNYKRVLGIDSKTTGHFSTIYGDSTAGFTEVNLVTQLNNTQYWDPSTHALTELSNNQYTLRYIFQLIGNPDEVYSWIGTSQYSNLSQARLGTISNDLPVQLQSFLGISKLIAKVIVQQGNADVVDITQITNPDSQSTPTVNHDELALLNIGDYKHLTATEYSNLTSLLTGIDTGLVEVV